jgi:hypothetical protein
MSVWFRKSYAIVASPTQTLKTVLRSVAFPLFVGISLQACHPRIKKYPLNLVELRLRDRPVSANNLQ